MYYNIPILNLLAYSLFFFLDGFGEDLSASTTRISPLVCCDDSCSTPCWWSGWGVISCPSPRLLANHPKISANNFFIVSPLITLCKTNILATFLSMFEEKASHWVVTDNR